MHDVQLLDVAKVSLTESIWGFWVVVAIKEENHIYKSNKQLYILELVDDVELLELVDDVELLELVDDVELLELVDDVELLELVDDVELLELVVDVARK